MSFILELEPGVFSAPRSCATLQRSHAVVYETEPLAMKDLERIRKFTPFHLATVRPAMALDYVAITPSSRLDDIVTAAEARGMWTRINSPFEPGGQWFLGFCPHSTTGWNGRMDHEFSGATLAEAVEGAAEWLRQADLREYANDPASEEAR